MSVEAKDKPWQEIQKIDNFDRSLVKLRSSRSKFNKSICQQTKLAADDPDKSDENAAERIIILRSVPSRATSIDQYLNMDCGLKEIRNLI